MAEEGVRAKAVTVLAMDHWFNVLNGQSSTASALQGGLWREPRLIGATTLSVRSWALVLYAPPMRDLLHTVPLAPALLLPLVGSASLAPWAEEGRRVLARGMARRRAA